jgi:hypothetical protein
MGGFARVSRLKVLGVLMAGFLLTLLVPTQDANALPIPCVDIDVETSVSSTEQESSQSVDVCPYVSNPQPIGSDPLWNAMPTAAKDVFSLTNMTARVIRPVAVGGIVGSVPGPIAGELYTVRCWEGFHVWVEGKARAGNTLWTYHQEMDWCENGTRIKRHVKRLRWGETSTPGWHYRGHIGSQKSGGVGSTSATRWTQGKFQLCWAWCVQEAHPWISMTVYGNGSVSCDTSAGRPSGC